MANNESKSIKPELLGGFQDKLPDVMIPLMEMMDIIRHTFESFGFLPLETPCLERSSVLGTDKDEFKMEVYRFSDSYDGEGQDVTLRFDLTVPFSRVVAANPELVKPFKRYQTGKVFRKEKPQSGRYREFAQFDADTVGTDSIIADVETIQLMYQTLKNLGLDRFTVRFNDRKILNGLPTAVGFGEEKAPAVFRILDKIDKIGLDAVLAELARRPDNDLDDSAIALSDQGLAKLREFLAITGEPDAIIGQLSEFFKGVAIAEEGIGECADIIRYLRVLGIPSENWRFDLSIARGLGYYTGPVFETTLTDLPEIGSVFSGGRYDNLVMRYTGERMPATGASIGVDRLVAALQRLGKLKGRRSTAKVLVSIIDPSLQEDLMVLAQKLRQEGINAEVYLGRLEGVKSQIIYAAKLEIPFVVIYGSQEKEAGKYRLKDMTARTEQLLSFDEIVNILK